ncbi:MAG: hypothetical protein KJN85_12805, partial [Maribacter sp.]|nr:hypothetical protein [Maribacter sp.]
AIKSVENVITPFIQKLTISGIYKKGNNVPLTGPEIVTLMEFNLFGGIITKVNDDNIEITIRGKAVMAELFEASTDVNELQGVCDN